MVPYTDNVLLLLLIKYKIGEQTEGVHNIKMVVFWKGKINAKKKALHAYYSHGCLACVHAI